MTRDQIAAQVKSQATQQQSTVAELITLLGTLKLAQPDVDKVETLTARLKHETDAILTAVEMKPDAVGDGEPKTAAEKKADAKAHDQAEHDAEAARKKAAAAHRS